MFMRDTAPGGGPDSVISRAARALAREPQVIASALDTYRARTGMSEAELAAWLELNLPRLHALALCTKPRPSECDYSAAVMATGRHNGCNPYWLQQVLCVDRAIHKACER